MTASRSFRPAVPGAPRPTRVLLVARHLVGGIRTYFKYVYARMDPGEFVFSLVAVDTEEMQHVATDLHPHVLDTTLVPEGRPLVPLGLAVRRAIGEFRPDVVQAHGFTAGVVTNMVNVPRRAPVLLTSHDVLHQEEFRSLTGRMKGEVVSRVLARSAALQSVSHDAQQNLTEVLPRLRRHRRLLVIPNGIDVGLYSSAQDVSRPPTPTPTLLFVGRLMPQKGFLDLVSAVDLLKQEGVRVHVLVAGDFGFAREYQRDVRSRGLSDQFDFLGFLPDVAALLRRVDAQVMPSLWEAAGLAAMEAFVSGCPLIATRCIGLREIIADTPALVAEPAAPADLAEAIRRFLRDPHGARERARQFAPLAASRFDVAKTTAALRAELLRLSGRLDVHRDAGPAPH